MFAETMQTLKTFVRLAHAHFVATDLVLVIGLFAALAGGVLIVTGIGLHLQDPFYTHYQSAKSSAWYVLVFHSANRKLVILGIVAVVVGVAMFVFGRLRK